MSRRKARGSETERMILAAGEFYAMQGIGWVAKHEPPVKMTRSRGLIHVGKSDPDFLGHWRGRFFALEAKEVTSRPSLRVDEAHFSRGQAERLVRVARSGGDALLIVFFKLKITERRGVVREAFLLAADKDPLCAHCPISRWAIRGEGGSLNMDWFREHAISVPEDDMGLAWGRALDQYGRR